MKTDSTKVQEGEPEIDFLKKILVDFGIILPICIMMIISNEYFIPFHRGFYCADVTIKYPLKKETVSLVSLYLISLGFPLIFLGMGEILFASEADYEGDVHHHICKWRVPKAFVRTYDIIVSFLFGFLVCSLVVIMSQNTLGVLRPNFLALCRPDVNCSTSSQFEFHEKYQCQNLDKYSRLSFPSKHATYCFYTMVYLSVYLQNKVRWEYLSVCNNCMQVGLIVTAWLVSLTCVTDYYHHATDILGGIIIGSIVAWYNVCAVYNFFESGLRMNTRPKTN